MIRDGFHGENGAMPVKPLVHQKVQQAGISEWTCRMEYHDKVRCVSLHFQRIDHMRDNMVESGRVTGQILRSGHGHVRPVLPGDPGDFVVVSADNNVVDEP